MVSNAAIDRAARAHRRNQERDNRLAEQSVAPPQKRQAARVGNGGSQVATASKGKRTGARKADVKKKKIGGKKNATKKPRRAAREDEAFEAAVTHPRPTGWVSDMVRPGPFEYDDKKQASPQGPTIRKHWAVDNPPAWSKHGTWHIGEGFGSGAYGTVLLCYRVDDNTGMITNRCVIKDTYCPHKYWTSWERWWGDPRDAAKREHMEIRAMLDIRNSDRPERTKCVEYLHHERNDARLHHRIYMSWCPLDSLLQNLPAEQGSRPDPTEKPRAVKRLAALAKKDEMHGHAYDDLPEPVLWKWMEDLTMACVLMSDMQVDLDRTGKSKAPELRRTMVHRDFKYENVFLDLPSGEEGEWPSYPVARLGDFGLAIYTHEDDPNNPIAYNCNGGTHGWLPSELDSYVRESTLEHVNLGRLSSATNVWAVGTIVMRAMNHTYLENPIEAGPYYNNEHDLEPRLTEHSRDHYSSELCDLVERCVAFRPRNRIDVHTLLEEIRRYTGLGEAGEPDLARGMRFRAHGPTEGDLKVWHAREMYRVGMTPADAKEDFKHVGRENAEMQEILGM